jgi:hypothetical protein
MSWPAGRTRCRDMAFVDSVAHADRISFYEKCLHLHRPHARLPPSEKRVGVRGGRRRPDGATNLRRSQFGSGAAGSRGASSGGCGSHRRIRDSHGACPLLSFALAIDSFIDFFRRRRASSANLLLTRFRFSSASSTGATAAGSFTRQPRHLDHPTAPSQQRWATPGRSPSIPVVAMKEQREEAHS